MNKYITFGILTIIVIVVIVSIIFIIKKFSVENFEVNSGIQDPIGPVLSEEIKNKMKNSTLLITDETGNIDTFKFSVIQQLFEHVRGLTAANKARIDSVVEQLKNIQPTDQLRSDVFQNNNNVKNLLDDVKDLKQNSVNKYKDFQIVFAKNSAPVFDKTLFIDEVGNKTAVGAFGKRADHSLENNFLIVQ